MFGLSAESTDPARVASRNVIGYFISATWDLESSHVRLVPIESLKSQSGRRSLLADRVDLQAGETRLAIR